jgi:tetratricopeptide (TPR) repeat protein
MPRPTVFISYRRQSSDHMARLVYDRLRTMGLDVFYDRETINGERFASKIQAEIIKRDYLLLLLAADTLESEWVRREIQTALEHNKSIIPLCDEGVSLARLKIPPEIARLNEFDDIRYDREYVDAAFERVRLALGVGDTPSLELRRALQKRSGLLWWVAVAVAVIALILGAVQVIPILMPQPTPPTNTPSPTTIPPYPVDVGIVTDVVATVAEPETLLNGARRIPPMADYRAGGDYIDIARALALWTPVSNDEAYEIGLLQANSYLFAACYRTAIDRYTALIARDPNWDIAYHNRGVAYMNLQYEIALRDPNASISEPERCDRKDPVARLDYLALAFDDFGRVIKTSANPDLRALAYINRGTAYFLVQDDYGAGSEECLSGASQFQNVTPSIADAARLCEAATVIDRAFEEMERGCDLTDQREALKQIRTARPETLYWQAKLEVTEALCQGEAPDDSERFKRAEQIYADFLEALSAEPTAFAVRRDQLEDACEFTSCGAPICAQTEVCAAGAP